MSRQWKRIERVADCGFITGLCVGLLIAHDRWAWAWLVILLGSIVTATVRLHAERA